MTGRVRVVAASLVAGLLAAGCTGTSPGPGATTRDTLTAGPLTCVTTFVLRDASAQPGRATPLAAARAFATSGKDAGLPTSGWVLRGTGEGQAVVRSGDIVLHAFTGPDGKWRVGSEQRCRYLSPTPSTASAPSAGGAAGTVQPPCSTKPRLTLQAQGTSMSVLINVQITAAGNCNAYPVDLRMRLLDGQGALLPVEGNPALIQLSLPPRGNLFIWSNWCQSPRAPAYLSVDPGTPTNPTTIRSPLLPACIGASAPSRLTVVGMGA